MNSTTCQSIGVCITLHFVALWTPYSIGQEFNAHPNALFEATDSICGPRCVQFVLKRYGKKEDLARLVLEAKTPGSTRGNTLHSLERLLQKRGIYTRGIRIGRLSDLEWEGPAILHLELGKNGHYVVWLGSPEGKARIWDGLKGLRVISNQEFRELHSGVVLLTSRAPISNDAVFARRSSFVTHAVDVVSLLVALLGIYSIITLLSKIRKRRLTHDAV